MEREELRATVSGLLSDFRDSEDRNRAAREADEQESRDRRRTNILKYIVAPIVTAVIGGGGLTSWRLANAPKSVDPEAVQQTVSDRANTIDTRVNMVERKVERLGTIAVEQQVQFVDGVEYIGDKIDLAHPKQAGKVSRPTTFQRAVKKAEAIKKKKAVEDLFREEEDPTNPFAGLDASPPPVIPNPGINAAGARH